MGNLNFDSNLKNQVIHYYIFHKKLEMFFKHGYNPFFIEDNRELKIQKFYVIDKYLEENWKYYCNYFMFKAYFDGIKLNNNFKEYKEHLEKIFDKTNKTLKLGDINGKLDLENISQYKWFKRNILELRHFDNILDEKSYEYFKQNLRFKKKSEIKGVITKDKMVLFFKNCYLMKFLYYGEIADPSGASRRELIQLTADFTKYEDISYYQSTFIETFNYFKQLILDF